MSTTAPFGTWPSPITPGTITTRTVLLSQVRVDGGDTYWVEQRASQAGRNVLLRRDGDGQIGEVLPLTPADGTCALRIGMDATFQQGVYRIRTRIVDSPMLESTTIHARQEGRLSFEIVDDKRLQFTGFFPVPMDVQSVGE